MKVLVTGPFGNVGGHTLPELRRQGHEVRAVARLSTANRKAAKAHDVEVVWGDITDPAAVARAADGVHTVIHLAAVIPPTSDEQPDWARKVNVDGTANVIAACQAAGARLLFASTMDVHGYTIDRPPPRHIDDPLVGTDPYSNHKIEGEASVRASGLDWSILRLADVPILGIRDPHPIMFEIGLHNRIETMHADDAGLALTNALAVDEVWGRTLFVGGGPRCQITYREYVSKILGAMGIAMLPDEAFSDKPYATDWLDTEESEARLRYQRYSFDDIAEQIAASLGWKRRFASAAAPMARSAILRLSPYYRAAR